jgi:hypothetical protein
MKKMFLFLVISITSTVSISAMAMPLEPYEEACLWRCGKAGGDVDTCKSICIAPAP